MMQRYKGTSFGELDPHVLQLQILLLGYLLSPPLHFIMNVSGQWLMKEKSIRYWSVVKVGQTTKILMHQSVINFFTYFELESIIAAIEDFLEKNMLGQGGFGPVYKGKLPRGEEIAVKRLSSLFGQGLQEFKNEVMLIAKLRH
uniref:Protein kinase domain-containing protein n=1 Tax=Lactuca sativa TaxID=4236 RepID=A0A9R1XF22_LACSA|nr:hypothetical protein LSAT_V11C400173040 [Lactuca sativa]